MRKNKRPWNCKNFGQRQIFFNDEKPEWEKLKTVRCSECHTILIHSGAVSFRSLQESGQEFVTNNWTYVVRER